MSYYKVYERKNNTRSDRYRKCRLLKDKETNSELVETRDIESISESFKDLFHTVKTHEAGRLDLIAHNYYKNALYWWVIAQANDIYDPISGVKSGMLLRIPTVDTLYGYNGILL